MSEPEFRVVVDHNPYLPVGQREVSAVVAVVAPAAAPSKATGSVLAAEVIILDCSKSMDYPPAKMAHARAAAAAAVDVIRDGVLFAIVAGTSKARPVYPEDGSMALADARTRAEAKDAVSRLQAGGGTAMGQWLRLAHQIFQSSPAALRHAILLADGTNQHETTEEFDAAIALCEGTFRCDCRGVGTDWSVSELRKISTALLGTLDIVPDPVGLPAEFEKITRDAMSKQFPGVALRIWTPHTAAPKFVKQIIPFIADLTGGYVPSGAETRDYPVGAYAPEEIRDYHVCVELAAASAGQEALAARVSVVVSSPDGEQVHGHSEIRVTWTDG